MAAPTYYVETSVWGSLAPRQPADRKRIVRRFLDLLDGVRGCCAISEGVRMEIDRAPATTAAALHRHIASRQLIVYPITEDVEELARAYIVAAILPERRQADAVHVAVATCFSSDYLVSWNHRHMTRPTKRLQFEAVNQLNGYWKTPLI
jgi:hypothetical protein